MSIRIAVGAIPGAALAYALEGSDVVGQATGHNADEAIAALGIETGRVIEIGSGPPDALPARIVPASGRTLPGFTQDNPVDEISAWERLKIAGFLADHPNWDGVICCLETGVSHWVHVSADEAVSCQSFLTPKLIAALGGALPADQDAADETLSRPERLAAHLRTAEVSGAHMAMSGHLIGAELAAARAYWLGQQVAVISDGKLGNAYATALTAQAVPVTVDRARDTLHRGLGALAKAFYPLD